MSPMLIFGVYAAVLIGAMYLFAYIPNKKKQKKMQEMHNALKPGDEIITVGGIVGKIIEKDKDYVTICIDEEKQVSMKIVIYAVAQVKE